jgi:hypothetical protein
MKLALCLALAALAILPAFADVNVSGNWTGTFTATGPDGETHDSEALLVLKQTGSQITGTAGPNGGERYDITKGSIDGNKISIDIQEGDHTVHFDLTLADDRLTGEANATTPDGGHLHAKLDVKRAK